MIWSLILRGISTNQPTSNLKFLWVESQPTRHLFKNVGPVLQVNPTHIRGTKMTITAQIIADSISPEGIRLTTMQLRYPRFIHSEFLTHRTFSRNASSSRAIPVARMIEDLHYDPAIPIYWGSNKPGMQAGAELTGEDLLYCKTLWLQAMELNIDTASRMVEAGLHKQIANRIIEPWAHINVVCTSTDWANFFALRAHADAQPEIKELAEAMMAAMGQSDPILMAPGMWHLPYISSSDIEDACAGEEPGTDYIDVLKKVSVARCARVSYLTHDGRPTSVQEDLALYEKLVVSQPSHSSPAEHQATPDSMQIEGACEHTHFTESGAELDLPCDGWNNPHLHGNLRGWCQLRKMLPNEFVPG